MKGVRIAVSVFCFHLVLLACSAQQPIGNQPPIAAAATQTPAEQMRNTVAFLQTMYRDGQDIKGVIGTCFFIQVLDKRLGENSGFSYLVTNRHVAQPGIDLGTPHEASDVIITLNLVATQNGVESTQGRIPFSNEVHWYFPQDDAVDLAILPFAPDPNQYSYKSIPSSMIVTSDKITSDDVVVGDRVIFSGYFSNFPGRIRIEPIIREGVIAMMPDENIDTTLHKPGRLYLADLYAFHGNSGSPVFVNTSGTHHGGILLGESYLLLGLISGYYPESAGYSVPAATALTGEVRDNSGIATIVPADELKKLLDSAGIRAQQDSVMQNCLRNGSRAGHGAFAFLGGQIFPTKFGPD
jgi:Trypsin-like peptidase domain